MKRATTVLRKAYAVTAISIHALVKRATVLVMIYGQSGTDFNPRPREEGDR